MGGRQRLQVQRGYRQGDGCGRLGAECRLRLRLGVHQGRPRQGSGRPDRSGPLRARARGDWRREPPRRPRHERCGGREDLRGRRGHEEGRRRQRCGRGRRRVRLRQPAHRRGEIRRRKRHQRVLPRRLPRRAGRSEELRGQRHGERSVSSDSPASADRPHRRFRCLGCRRRRGRQCRCARHHRYRRGRSLP